MACSAGSAWQGRAPSSRSTETNTRWARPPAWSAGFFPVILGWILVVLGLLIALPACWRRGEAVVVQWRNLFWSVLGVVAFAALLKTVGVVAACVRPPA